ncbi:MAG: hypothetical protein ACOZEN_14015 [Thermodesulfobacteriota bacterium]
MSGHTMRRSGGREAIWAEIKKRAADFTAQDLARGSGATLCSVREYLTGLRKAGYVEAAGDTENPSGNPGSFQRTVYRLAKDPGIDAPRVRKDGTELPEMGRDRLWRAMRILKEFSVRDLTVQASLEEAPVAESEAAFYCLYLARAGYLFEIEANKRFRFLAGAYTGPKAPVIRRVREVIDANTGEVRWSGDEREERP